MILVQFNLLKVYTNCLQFSILSNSLTSAFLTLEIISKHLFINFVVAIVVAFEKIILKHLKYFYPIKYCNNTSNTKLNAN